MRAGNTIQVRVNGRTIPGVSLTKLRDRADAMLQQLEVSCVEVSVTLMGNAAMRTLNREYRGKDKPTDVLAFPLLPLKPGRPLRRPLPPKMRPTGGMPLLLGDVLLCVPVARRQAQTHGQSLLAELTFLLAHGLLHLLGYDHQTDRQELEMMKLNRQLLANVSGSREKKVPRRDERLA
jgi:probable rRNA maturation factor